MRSQINSQILVFILAVIIMGVVLLFGSDAIRHMIDNQRMVELVKFKSAVASDITKLSTQYKTSKIITYNVPSSIRELCFVDLDFGTRSGGNDPVIPTDDPNKNYFYMAQVVHDMLIGEVDRKNLFLCPGCTESYDVGNIELQVSGADVGFLCFPVKNGIARLTIEGRGKGVTISSPPV